jgi:hypothetical protein
MGQILKGQVIASTHRDRHGERLSKAELEQLLAGMPEQRLMNYNHDPRRPPIARAFYSRLERLDDGEYAIRSDIEVLDEEAFPTIGGVSIAFTRVPLVGHGEPEPELEISFNPRMVERARLEEALGGWDRLESEAVLLERSEKAIETILLIWLIVANGFWSELGADVYRFAKSLIKETFSIDKQTEVAVEIKTGRDEPQLILTVDADSPEEPVLDVDGLIAEACALAPANEIVKVVAEIGPDGEAVIVYAVDAAGTLFGRVGR